MSYDLKRDDKNRRRIYQDLCGIEFMSHWKRSKDDFYSSCLIWRIRYPRL